MDEWKILVPYVAREAMTPRAAARLAARSEATIRNWCETRGIGRKVEGRWEVSRVAFAMLLDGDQTALDQYHIGNISAENVKPYYQRLGL